MAARRIGSRPTAAGSVVILTLMIVRRDPCTRMSDSGHSCVIRRIEGHPRRRYFRGMAAKHRRGRVGVATIAALVVAVIAGVSYQVVISPGSVAAWRSGPGPQAEHDAEPSPVAPTTPPPPPLPTLAAP